MGRICTSKKYLKIPRSTSKYLEVPQSTQKYFKVLKVPQCTQKYLKVLRSTSKYLEVPQRGFRKKSGAVVPLAMFPSQIKFAGTWPGARCRGNVQLTGFTRNRVACHSCHTCMSHWTKIFFSGPDNSVQFTFHSLALQTILDHSVIVPVNWSSDSEPESDHSDIQIKVITAGYQPNMTMQWLRLARLDVRFTNQFCQIQHYVSVGLLWC